MKLYRAIISICFLLVTNNVLAVAQYSTDVNLTKSGANVTVTNPIPAQLIGSSATGYKELQVTDNGLKVDTTIGSASVNVINEPAININKIKGQSLTLPMLPAHPYEGCSKYATKTGTALSNQLLIDISSSQTLYVKGISIFNYSTTGGAIDFWWDSAGTILCFPSTLGNTVGSGYIADVNWIGGIGQDLYVTTAPTSLGITIYYIVQ